MRSVSEIIGFVDAVDAQSSIEDLWAWIAVLERRLEIDAVQTTGASGQNTRHILPRSERYDLLDEGRDGIGRRDQAIQDLGEEVRSLKDTLAGHLLTGIATTEIDDLAAHVWHDSMVSARDTVASITIVSDGMPIPVTQDTVVTILDHDIEILSGSLPPEPLILRALKARLRQATDEVEMSLAS